MRVGRTKRIGGIYSEVGDTKAIQCGSLGILGEQINVVAHGVWYNLWSMSF